jgi:hypothetical protein
MSVKQKRKVWYALGGMGIKPDQRIRSISPGPFTKGSRGAKPQPSNRPFAYVEEWYPTPKEEIQT